MNGAAQQVYFEIKEVIVIFKVKRVYGPSSRDDGQRVMIDRLWPRGLRKKERFLAELDAKADWIDSLVDAARKGTVTLLSGSKEERFNNAVALKEYLDARMKAAEGEKAEYRERSQIRSGTLLPEAGHSFRFAERPKGGCL